MSCSEDERDDFGAAEEHSILHDEEEPEDVISDLDEVPKSKKKKKAKKSSRESRSSKRQRPIREVSLLSCHSLPVGYIFQLLRRII
ncbi:hypothetical protein XENORESO_004253 [Xenotaenia resolanae]|uniref:Uncharacterized protein n=1 Tax=Xenotaenia resolanae TaxID=208358 RepID=A0ABV0WIS5_9TELE